MKVMVLCLERQHNPRRQDPDHDARAAQQQTTDDHVLLFFEVCALEKWPPRKSGFTLLLTPLMLSRSVFKAGPLARAFSTTKPLAKPANPNFGSGPCSKRPGACLQYRAVCRLT